MALVHLDQRQLHLKIVYYGPGFGGKTTNLMHLHNRIPPHLRGQWVALKSEEDRTLYFDFLPLNLGSGSGFQTRIHLYTVPGQVRFRRSRLVMLRDVDGIIFVADSHPNRLHANEDSLKDLEMNLVELGLDLTKMPKVFQLNKRDLDPKTPEQVMRRSLGVGENPCFHAVANQGRGVLETLKTMTKMVLRELTPAP
ncbi:MAG: gliding-motility protein MglA [Candidatus Eisenbacteria bacterium]|uniref:Gliding-motility protein MglA n=1 Tax=Eiseniibacteriota bacterium TaxID=2212470 RepID=A0A948RUE8_UNCEI|nr:gliding-motility protein MglA [Candidatus Eisenbacteria bacterium]MBU1950644.1 gliding-motility protein MglA [Candidatus Eisenbacteria bacterium]MBU2689657.1 gliding-motility protein MglA [Candidatus Eisenbacteria bacterium]